MQLLELKNKFIESAIRPGILEHNVKLIGKANSKKIGSASAVSLQPGNLPPATVHCQELSCQHNLSPEEESH